MARPDPEEPLVKGFAALLYNSEAALEDALGRLGEAFSLLDFRGAPHPFDQTDYYRDEMGAGLRRVLVSFRELWTPPALIAARHGAAAIEDALRTGAGNRTVNIDVGTLDLFKVVLASFKGRGNKLYLGQGVWADLTLTYSKGRFHRFEWTFPDFRGGRYDADLLAIRALYREQLKGA